MTTRLNIGENRGIDCVSEFANNVGPDRQNFIRSGISASWAGPIVLTVHLAKKSVVVRWEIVGNWLDHNWTGWPTLHDYKNVRHEAYPQLANSTWLQECRTWDIPSVGQLYMTTIMSDMRHTPVVFVFLHCLWRRELPIQPFHYSISSGYMGSLWIQVCNGL